MNKGHDVSISIRGRAHIDSLTSSMQNPTVRTITPTFRRATTPDEKMMFEVVGHVDSLPGFLVALAFIIEAGCVVDFINTAKTF